MRSSGPEIPATGGTDSQPKKVSHRVAGGHVPQLHHRGRMSETPHGESSSPGSLPTTHYKMPSTTVPGARWLLSAVHSTVCFHCSPLNRTFEKDSAQRVQWSQDCENAFWTLHTCLCQEPVLYSPDFDQGFILHTDATEVGHRAVLSQDIDGNDHAVLYLSQKLFPCKNYTVLEKEALAVKWACDALQFYLLGALFTLVTDHAPLQWLTRMKNNNNRLPRWYLALQPYAFTIRHRGGKDHANADFLSPRGMEVPGPDEQEPDLGCVCVCSEAVWLPATPERDEPIRVPEWAETGSSEPTPQRVRRRPGSIKARPQSSLRAQPLRRPDASSLARDWETPTVHGACQELPDLPCVCYPEKLPDLPCARYLEEPMVLDAPEDIAWTQILCEHNHPSTKSRGQIKANLNCSSSSNGKNWAGEVCQECEPVK
ncbi:unnamed protein product [Lepidochelys kempii]